jgi:hypothetical protein
LEHKCSGIPCYISKEEAKKIIIEALENDEVSKSALEWVVDSVIGKIHMVHD